MKAKKELTPKERIGCGIVVCLMIGTCVFVMGYEDTNHKSAPTVPETRLSEQELMFQRAKAFLPGNNFDVYGLDGLVEIYGDGKHTDWTTDDFGFIYFPGMNATVNYDQHTRIIISVYKGKVGK